jgi:serine/threonine protein kinase
VLLKGLMPGSSPMIAGGVATYILGNQLGAGGMGVVYEATCATDGEPVAIKFLQPDKLTDPREVRRFESERICGLLVSHPNVPAVLDRGETAAGEPFFVMERVCGEPLGLRIARDGALSPFRAVRIARQILGALAAIHDGGIVHADVKSDNVLLETRADGTDVCKLIDFGLAHAQFAAETDEPDEPPDWLSGTPEYMAPEVIRGEVASFTADLYAVGMILYEMLVGQTPFAGGTVKEIVQRHLEDEVVPPSLRCTHYDLPSSLDYVVLRAVRKLASQRFDSARAFDAGLAQVERELRGHRALEEPAPRRTRDFENDVRRLVRSPPRGRGAQRPPRVDTLRMPSRRQRR